MEKWEEEQINHFLITGNFDANTFIQCNSCNCIQNCSRNKNVDFITAAPIYLYCKDYKKKDKGKD